MSYYNPRLAGVPYRYPTRHRFASWGGSASDRVQLPAGEYSGLQIAPESRTYAAIAVLKDGGRHYIDMENPLCFPFEGPVSLERIDVGETGIGTDAGTVQTPNEHSDHIVAIGHYETRPKACKPAPARWTATLAPADSATHALLFPTHGGRHHFRYSAAVGTLTGGTASIILYGVFRTTSTAGVELYTLGTLALTTANDNQNHSFDYDGSFQMYALSLVNASGAAITDSVAIEAQLDSVSR